MLEVIYRIYQVAENDNSLEEDEMNNRNFYDSISSTKNVELTMDCLICETRDAFKDIIRDMYGKDIRFAYSKKLQPGDVYCIIIGEHCYNTEKYFNRVEFECDCCHAKVSGFVNSKIQIDGWDFDKLLNQHDKYDDKKFCSMRCKDRYVHQEALKIAGETDAQNIFVTKDMFTNHNLAGYIYKITKKSTGEFYVGQTIYVPIFRWGQHLTTERFKIENILDYKFEVIELVPSNENILDREKYWIQKLYKEHPDLSLNISQTKNIISSDEELEENENNGQTNNS